MSGLFDPGVLSSLPSDPVARAVAEARALIRWRLMMSARPKKRGRGRPKKYGDSLLTQKPPRRTGRRAGRPELWSDLVPWGPLALFAETWMEQERKHPDVLMSWTRVLRAMTSPRWQIRDADNARMEPARALFSPWRGREGTLRARFYEMKKDQQLVANARLALSQNRPEVVPTFDRVFGQADFPAGLSDK